MALQVEEIRVQEAMYKSTSWDLLRRVSTYRVTTVQLGSDWNHEYTEHIAQTTITTLASFWIMGPSKYMNPQNCNLKCDAHNEFQGSLIPSET